MQNSERQQFEKSWQSAFEGAEMSPPDSLWNSIELEVAGRETDVMRRRVVLYQRVAAATVIFAVVSGAVAVYNYRGAVKEVASVKNSVSNPVADTATQPGSIASSTSPSSSASTLPPATSVPRTVSKSRGKSDNGLQQGPPVAAVTVPMVVLAKDDDRLVKEESTQQTAPPGNEQLLTSQATPDESAVATKQPAVEETVAELLSAEEVNALAEAKEKEGKEKTDHSTWLGVGGAAGSYTPKASMSGGKMMADADPYSSYAASQGIPQSAGHSVGSAYSAGVSAGVKLAKRWVVQSGINYISQQLDYTTNFVGVSTANKATAMTYEFMNAPSLSNVLVTNTYEASSNTQVLSVPVQAGFIIVDRRLGWQLNSGVSTDFFLQNTLSDKSGLREDISQGSGGDSPYRAVNWSGLLNTEVSYRIGEHYRLAVVPGIRYTFQSYIKDQSGGSPLIVDLGFRLKYLFN